MKYSTTQTSNETNTSTRCKDYQPPDVGIRIKQSKRGVNKRMFLHEVTEAKTNANIKTTQPETYRSIEM